MLNPTNLRAYEQPVAKLTAQQAHATDRCAHEIIAILTPLQALAAADARGVGRQLIASLLDFVRIFPQPKAATPRTIRDDLVTCPHAHMSTRYELSTHTLF